MLQFLLYISILSALNSEKKVHFFGMKNNIFIVLLQNIDTFRSISLDNQIKHKPLISGEWGGNHTNCTTFYIKSTK